MQVGQLWRYPVKSMAGEPLQTASLGPYGIPGDRVLYVVDGRGEMLSARTKPRLLRHRATLGDEGRVLVDGLPWDGPEVAAIVRDAAGPGARLVQAGGPERFDILPLLVVTDGALDVFGHDPMRLRPNLVISGVEGLTERTWEQSLLVAGDAVIALANLRGRCITTTWDPVTGEQDVGVLRDIRARFDGTFALNAWVGRSGDVSIGDSVVALEEPVQLERPLMGRFT